MKSSNYLMWGVIPITFHADGTWEPCGRSYLCKTFLTAVIDTLLHANVAVERLFNYQVELHVPLVPVADSAVVKALRFLARPFSSQPHNGSQFPG